MWVLATDTPWLVNSLYNKSPSNPPHSALCVCWCQVCLQTYSFSWNRQPARSLRAGQTHGPRWSNFSPRAQRSLQNTDEKYLNMGGIYCWYLLSQLKCTTVEIFGKGRQETRNANRTEPSYQGQGEHKHSISKWNQMCFSKLLHLYHLLFSSACKKMWSSKWWREMR